MPNCPAPLTLDLYELTMAQAYFIYKPDTAATFDLFVRGLPKQRSYLVAAGLADVVDYIKNLKFSSADLRYLRRKNLFCEDFLGYLKGFRFQGDIWAMREGEVFFPDEPVLRVTAPIIEAQIIESFLLNTINLQSMIASKASRVVNAAKDRKVVDFSLRRTHGAEAGLKAARSSYIAGFDATSCVEAGRRYGIPVAGTMAHSFVMSFNREIDSFLAYAETFKNNAILLVDTYDTIKGIRNAVKIGLYLKEKGYALRGIRLDSGDIAFLSKAARRALDAAGLKAVKIFASGNLDEFKIKKLLKSRAKVDSFGVGTNMGTSIDAPCLDVIYKLSEVSDAEGKFIPAMKLSRGKVTYPGRKQVYRVKHKNGCLVKDILGLEGEKISGIPLLRKVISGGRIIYKGPPLEKIRDFCLKNVSCLPEKLMRIDSPHKFTVEVSPGLKRLKKDLARHLRKKQ